MNDAAQLYYATQACLIEVERTGVMSEELMEEMREKMDGLWLQMDDAERARARKLAEEQLKKPPEGPILP